MLEILKEGDEEVLWNGYSGERKGRSISLISSRTLEWVKS